jgi:kelch-like protein 2/3
MEAARTSETLVNLYQTTRCYNPEEAVLILTRLRTGHTRLTHGFLLRGEDAPVCPHIDSALSVVHILIDCRFLQEARDIYQLNGTIRKILQDNRVFTNQVLAFLNYIEVYKTI